MLLKVDICAVVVDFRKPEITASCVMDLLASKHVGHVVVVTNAPLDGQVEKMAELLSGQKARVLKVGDVVSNGSVLSRCTILHSSLNNGYAYGLNIGYDFVVKSRIPSSHIWILNNDIRVSLDSIDEIACALQDNELDKLVSTCFKENGQKIPPFQKVFRGWAVWPKSVVSSRSAESLVGASIVISMKRAEQLFPLDEGYFLNFEDVEFCLKYRKLFMAEHPGHEPFLIAGEITHELSSSQGAQSHLHIYFYFRNLLRLAAKTGERHLLASYAVVYLVAIKSICLGNIPKGRVILCAIRDYKKGVEGNSCSQTTREFMASSKLAVSYNDH